MKREVSQSLPCISLYIGCDSNVKMIEDIKEHEKRIENIQMDDLGYPLETFVPTNLSEQMREGFNKKNILLWNFP